MRNTICQSIHSSLQQEDFIQVMTPIITSNDCEGAGEMFSYHCLVNLIQSCRRQNRFSILLQYFGLSNRIRAITSRNDGRSYDSSIYVWTSFSRDDLKQLAIHVISTVATNLLTKCQEDLSFLSQRIDKELPYQLSTLQNKDNYCHLTYSEAISILTRKGMHFEVPVKWGIDLQSEHERFLCEQYCQNKPLFLTDYPEAIKPFYMKANPDGKTVAAVDLLVPRIVGMRMEIDD